MLCTREVFAEGKSHGASINDVIRAAKIARDSFYNDFDRTIGRIRGPARPVPSPFETPGPPPSEGTGDYLS